MSTVAEMIDRLKSLDVKALIQDTLVEISPNMVQENRNQMLRGKTAEDKDIEPPYAERTRRRKGFSIPNLKEKGSFQNSMYADINSRTISFGSTDKKTTALYAKYGTSGAGNIFGLGPTAIDKIKPEASLVLVNKIKEKLQL